MTRKSTVAFSFLDEPAYAATGAQTRACGEAALR
jgi:hypothetical protein